MPAERAEGSLSARILAVTALVVAAIDLDDEADLGAREVDDVGPDDELTTEGKPGFEAAETAPEALLGARGRETHGASTLFEEASASRGDE
jgi:hypothetical protein